MGSGTWRQPNEPWSDCIPHSADCRNERSWRLKVRTWESSSRLFGKLEPSWRGHVSSQGTDQHPVGMPCQKPGSIQLAASLTIICKVGKQPWRCANSQEHWETHGWFSCMLFEYKTKWFMFIGNTQPVGMNAMIFEMKWEWSHPLYIVFSTWVSEETSTGSLRPSTVPTAPTSFGCQACT